MALGSLTAISGTAQAAKKATGTTLLIGVLETVTNNGTAPSGSRESQSEDIVKAWATETNATGGIDGHPVKVIALDTANDPGAALSDIAQLQSDHVLAIVGSSSPSTEPQWSTAITADHLPVIGGTAYTGDWTKNPLFYIASTSVAADLWGEVYSAKALHVKNPKVASLLCNNASVCGGATTLLAAAAKTLGIPLVYNQTANSTSTTYTPQCLAMKSSGANIMIPAAINVVALVTDCKRQGFNPLVVQTTLNATPAEIHSAPTALAGVAGSSTNFIPSHEFPPLKGYFNLVKKYAPAYAPGGSKYNSVFYDNALSNAYVATQVFAKAVENAKVPAKKTVTRTDLIKGLSMFHGTTLGGMTPPITYGDGTSPNPPQYCFYLYKTANTKAAYDPVPANKLKYYCQPKPASSS